MNKTEAYLVIERLREGIRKLPADADIYGFAVAHDFDVNRRVASIHLCRPLDGTLAVPSRRFSGWHEMRLPLSTDVYAWWAENDMVDDDGNDS